MIKAIIFGINGQDGYYLFELLTKNNIEVIGISRSNPKWIVGDVADRNFVTALIIEHRPAYIFHLAANSTTQHNVLFEHQATIATGTLNILETVYQYSNLTKVFLSGSGLQFVNNGLPIKESDPFEAQSTYSIARIQSAYAARYYRKLGLKVYLGYFFNHDSSLRSEKHVNQKIISTFKRIAAGSSEKLALYDVTSKKEFGFAGDMMKAIWILVNQDKIYEATIGTGLAYTIADWLNLCAFYFNLNWKEFVIVENSTENKKLVSDPSTINELGWKPHVDINVLAKMMILNER